MQANDQERRVRLALAEHGRLHQQIATLEQRAELALDCVERELLAGLRMCRAHVERELRRRGWAYEEGEWQQPS
jgi:hypothetical protein